MEDFVPWVAPISSCPPTSEEEEEEDEMADLVHNFGARKHKRGASFKRVTDATLEVVGEADQHPISEGSDRQVIIIMDSPEIGFHGQSASETVLSEDLGKVFLTHAKVREGIPQEQISSRPDKATSSRSGHSKQLLLDRLLLKPMEEVSAHGLESAQEIINL